MRMDVIITWVLFVGLSAVVSYSLRRKSPPHAEAAQRDGKPLPRARVARMLASFDALDWGLSICAVGFLISAIAGTADTLF